MKKNISFKIILFTFLFLIQSCGIYVQYDYDSDVNFDNYSSYSFYQPDIDEVEISDLDKKRILKSLDIGLKSKGLEFKEERGNEKTKINWWILGGSLVFVIFTLYIGYFKVPFEQHTRFTCNVWN